MSAGRIELTIGLVSGFVAACIVANLWSVRIVSTPVGPLDAGTLVYPLTFTLRDLIHRLSGHRAALTTVVLAAGFSLAASLGTWVVGVLPTPAEVAGPAQTDFGAVLGVAPRIVLASVVAQIASGWFDTMLYRRWVARFGERLALGRVVFSNAGSIPLDSFVFAGIAFMGEMPLTIVIGVAVSNIAVKAMVSLLIAPGILFVGSRPGKLTQT